MIIKVDNYMCNKCYTIKAFDQNRKNEQHICSACGKEMEYRGSEDIDSETNRVVARYGYNTNVDVKKILTGVPTIKCPYCHSTNTKKITTTSKAVHTVVFGIFSMSRNSKEWHCNNCRSDF